jgi:cell division protease FtsH
MGKVALCHLKIKRRSDSGSRAEIEAALATLIAGRAAERLLLGDVSAGAGGPAQSDLARATAIAAALEVSLGLGDRAIWLAAPEEVLPLLRKDRGLRTRVERHLRRAEARATAILGANRIVLERLAGKLQAQRIIARAELDALLAGVRSAASAARSGLAASMTSEHDLSARSEPEPPGTGDGPATVAPE